MLGERVARETRIWYDPTANQQAPATQQSKQQAKSEATKEMERKTISDQ